MQAAYEVLKQIHPTKSTIDENTWYDLDLWSVFQQLNATKSSVGSEYLYYRLRSYDFDEQIISELTQMADDFDADPNAGSLANCFAAVDYQLKAGVSRSKNAIKLLATLDYPKEVVEKAQAAAIEFEKTRIWKRL